MRLTLLLCSTIVISTFIFIVKNRARIDPSSIARQEKTICLVSFVYLQCSQTLISRLRYNTVCFAKLVPPVSCMFVFLHLLID